MGAYSLSTTISTPFEVKASRATQDFYHSNGHCEGPREVVWNVNATPGGWKIDPNSITVHEGTKNGDTQNYGAINRSATGFQLGGMVRNQGGCVCVPPFGCVSHDARGWLGVKATYTEFLDQSKSEAGPLETGVLNWGHDMTFHLPASTTAFSLDVKQIDGRTFVDTSAPTTRGWYSITYNSENKILVVRPKELSEALR